MGFPMNSIAVQKVRLHSIRIKPMTSMATVVTTPLKIPMMMTMGAPIHRTDVVVG